MARVQMFVERRHFASMEKHSTFKLLLYERFENRPYHVEDERLLDDVDLELR